MWPEIAGKRLGVIGLGAIGVKVANTAKSLGMKVYGYDPYISVDAAWTLKSENTVESLLDHMEEVYAYMRQEHLPVTREEFESRAVLFYVLKQIEEFLRIKREFILKKEKM